MNSIRVVNSLQLFSVAALVALAGASAAQTQPPTWQAQYDGPVHYDEFATSVAVMPSGNVAVAGISWLEPQPGLLVPQFLTVLYSPQGAELWSRMHGSGFYGGNGAADQIAISPTGKIVTAGTRDLGSEFMVVQYDAAGTEEWEGIWPAASYYVAYVEDLDIDGAGNVYVCGDVSSGAGVAKFSPTGALLWAHAYNGTGLEIGTINALAISAAGDVFVCGTQLVASGDQFFSVSRLSPATGAPMWIHNYGPGAGTSSSEGQGLGTDGAGRVIACGLVSDTLSASTYNSFVAIAPDGTLVWRYDHNGPGARWGYVEDMVVDLAGNSAVAGWTFGPSFDVDGFALRMNGSALAWQNTFGGAAGLDDRAVAVGMDSSGNVYAGGWVQQTDIGFDVFSYNSAGTSIAHGRSQVPAGGSGYARDLAVGSGGRVYVVGDMASFPVTGGDAVTAAFDVGPPAVAFCFGDGSGTACPCGNASAVGAQSGCLSSIGTGGRLSANGTSSVSADTLVLQSNTVPNGPGLYFQGSNVAGGGAGVLFGDGLRCVSGTTVRLGIVSASSNASNYPGGTTPGPISVRGACAPGDIRHYQVWYRDTSPTFCTSNVFNLTNGVSVTWNP